MVVIKSAMFGDETGARDVTSSVSAAVKSGQSVTANSSLIPMLETSKNVRLSDQEVADIKAKAEQQCGGSNDNTCIQNRVDELSRTRLQSKIAEQQSTANTVAGRRLTVVVVDESGREREFVIPEGNTFTPPGRAPSSSSSSSSFIGPGLQFVTVMGSAGLVFLWVFSVVATYKTFMQAGYVTGAYVATAAAIFFPYSGFLIMVVFFAVMAYRKNAMSV